MVRYALPVVVALTLLFIGCGEEPTPLIGSAGPEDTSSSASDSVLPRIDFTQRNAQLRATLANGTCTEWKQRGDSLHGWLMVVTEGLERMVGTMELRPLDDMRVADSVYRANGEGERLYNDLIVFYALALRSAADISTLQRTEGLSMQVLTFPTAEDWRRQCFMNMPRAASAAILSKIATEALLLENSCLHSILKQCKRSVGGSPFPESDNEGE